MNISFLFLNRRGHSSTAAVMNPSTVQNCNQSGSLEQCRICFYSIISTWLSSPIRINMKKNRHDQIGVPGSCSTADGYTRNARPGPMFEGLWYWLHTWESISLGICFKLVSYSPEAATSATGFCCSWAIKPTTENMTTPLSILVQELIVQTINASL